MCVCVCVCVCEGERERESVSVLMCVTSLVFRRSSICCWTSTSDCVVLQLTSSVPHVTSCGKDQSPKSQPGVGKSSHATSFWSVGADDIDRCLHRVSVISANSDKRQLQPLSGQWGLHVDDDKYLCFHHHDLSQQQW